jgi:hypothetical protein
MGEYQTVLARQGDWVLLPKNPFPREVWMNLRGPNGEAKHPNLKSLKDLGDFRIKIGDQFETVKTISVSNGKANLIERLSACICPEEDDEGKTKPPPVPRKFEIPFKEMLDNDGHLRGYFNFERECSGCC